MDKLHVAQPAGVKLRQRLQCLARKRDAALDLPFRVTSSILKCRSTWIDN